MKPFGGFDHNTQSLRVVTLLESRYAEFDGLNLTWETLEGAVKHNGPLLKDGRRLQDLPAAIVEYCQDHDLELGGHAGPEAQVAALSDDIAYNNHDIDDGLRAGLFTVADLHRVPLVGPVFEEVATRYQGLDEPRLVHEAIRRLIDRMVGDLIAETRRRLEASGVRSAAAVRRLGRPVVGFSAAMALNDRALKNFLFERMYRHYKVNRMSSKARRIVQDLFRLFLDEPQCLPTEWRVLADAPRTRETARTVADYIAGMTDRYALDEHARLFDTYSAH